MFYFSYKLPDDADAVLPWSTLWEDLKGLEHLGSDKCGLKYMTEKISKDEFIVEIINIKTNQRYYRRSNWSRCSVRTVFQSNFKKEFDALWKIWTYCNYQCWCMCPSKLMHVCAVFKNWNQQIFIDLTWCKHCII